jgi:hypothetical protein
VAAQPRDQWAAARAAAVAVSPQRWDEAITAETLLVEELI